MYDLVFILIFFIHLLPINYNFILFISIHFPGLKSAEKEACFEVIKNYRAGFPKCNKISCFIIKKTFVVVGIAVDSSHMALIKTLAKAINLFK